MSGAHVVHTVIVVAGLAGVAYLMLPQLVAPAPVRPGPGATTPLRRAAAPTGSMRRTAVPVAVIGSLAASGVHAVVAPAHVREGILLGAFFVTAALAQLGWPCLLVLHPSRRLLVLGAVGNAGLVLVWLLSRTVGLPGLGREAVGPWDAAAVTWELVVVAGCLAGREAPELPAWSRWSASARTFSVLSLLALGMLVVWGVLTGVGD